MTARGSVENKTSIDVALSRLAENMNPMVVEIIEDLAGRNLWSPASLVDTWKGKIGSVEDIRKSQDPALFLRLVLDEWDSGFSRVMSPQGASFPLVDKVRQIRNAISHNDMKLLGNQPMVEDSIKAINDLRAAVVKIDIRQIRSLETIEKPDGKYMPIRQTPGKPAHGGGLDQSHRVHDLRAAVVKIDIRQIRSLETIEKPDGKYTRIGYVKRPSPAKQMREGTKSAARNLWQRPVVKTVIIAIAAAVIFNLIISLPIRLAGLL